MKASYRKKTLSLSIKTGTKLVPTFHFQQLQQFLYFGSGIPSSCVKILKPDLGTAG